LLNLPINAITIRSTPKPTNVARPTFVKDLGGVSRSSPERSLHIVVTISLAYQSVNDQHGSEERSHCIGGSHYKKRSLLRYALTIVPRYGNLNQVRVIRVSKLDDFARRQAKARKPLANWEKIVRAASWKNAGEMKRTFNSVDYADRKTIFDVGGNNFRLIALVDFGKQLVQVIDVMTHAEYEKERWKD